MAPAPIRIGRDNWWGLPFLFPFSPCFATALYLFPLRGQGFVGEEGLWPALNHSFEHFKGDGKGNLVGLEKLSIRWVPAAQDGLELSLGEIRWGRGDFRNSIMYIMSFTLACYTPMRDEISWCAFVSPICHFLHQIER